MRYKIFILVMLFGHNCIAQPEKYLEYNIAYNIYLPDSVNDDNYEVFSMDMSGNNKKNITELKGVEWVYYAYKDRLYYISDKDTCHRCYFLYEMDIQGNNKRKISDLQLEDSWMSSRYAGKEMVVSGRIGKSIRYQLFVINIQTGKYRQITNDTMAMYTDPVFSPDGKQIVCSYKKNKRDTITVTELYIMDENCKNMFQLTHYPKDDPAYKSYHYKAGVARWHPSGDYITYISYQKGHNNIYCVTPDAKKNWRLTDAVTNENWYDWSDDGKWLVYDTHTTDDRQYSIVLMNWQTKQTTVLTDKSYRLQQAPVFVYSTTK